MKYTVRKSVIQVLGGIWMPYGAKAAMDIVIRPYDVENMKNKQGKLTRESVSLWLDSHAGDFSSIIDFRADIEDGEKTIVFDWKNEENMFAYQDATFGAEND